MKSIALFGLIFIGGCNLSTGQLRELNKFYMDQVRAFDPKHVDHFPQALKSTSALVLHSQDIFISHRKVWLKVSFTPSEIDSIITKASEKSMAIYDSDDSCLLVIDSYLNQQNYLKYDKTIRKAPWGNLPVEECNKNKLPVPKFWDRLWSETDKTKIALNPNYKLYILDSKKGLFMDEKLLPNGKLMPSGWEHGYTKGWAINKESSSVIFWFDIW